MTCTGRYAEAWQFASFWCSSSIASGVDDSGLPPLHATLGDSQANFVNAGAKANVGMILYNLTAGTNGPVTAVTQTSLTATGVTWTVGDQYRIVFINTSERATIENYLNITANDIHAARSQTGACDCALQEWALDYCAKINIIEAAAFYTCTCGSPQLTADDRKAYLEWASAQLELIRTGKIELCEGHTGTEYPAFDTVEQAWTDFNAVRIIQNRIARTP